MNGGFQKFRVDSFLSLFSTKRGTNEFPLVVFNKSRVIEISGWVQIATSECGVVASLAVGVLKVKL